MPKLDGKKYKYTKKGIMQYLIDKTKKKKKKKNSDKYGQIPSSDSIPENPIGGN